MFWVVGDAVGTGDDTKLECWKGGEIGGRRGSGTRGESGNKGGGPRVRKRRSTERERERERVVN